ncbi:transcription factor with AP2 domain(s) [Cryptosporidium felis]|nr:transcription factor with AP2 domain(s) [Cryptosporidium felis]
MAKSNNKSQIKDEKITDALRNCEFSAKSKSQHFFGNMKDIMYEMPKCINEGDEIFMQLQTELFDILLEIYNLIPVWGSFKENFYFHWKRIIGAFSFKDLHAYRLIFRCLGNLRPSSAPLFAIRPIIKQLDEYRKISEPEYLPVDFELKTNVQGNLISGSHAPFLMFQHLQSLNIPIASMNRQDLVPIENKWDQTSFTEQGDSKITSEVNKNNTLVTNLITSESENNKGIISVPSEKGNLSPASLQGNYSEELSEGMKCSIDGKFALSNINIQNSNYNGEKLSEIQKVSEELKDTNYHYFSEDSSSIELLKGAYSVPSCYSSNSRNSSPYSSACTASTLSPSEFNMSGPIMAAFHHIQAVAVAAAVANNGKNVLNATGHISASEPITQPPKKRPRRNGEIQGVYFDKIRKLWRANWKENGRVKTKGFSVFQFGDEGARQRAIDYRKKMEKEFYILPHSSKLSNINSINDETLSISPKNEGNNPITKIEGHMGNRSNRILNSSTANCSENSSFN